MLGDNAMNFVFNFFSYRCDFAFGFVVGHLLVRLMLRPACTVPDTRSYV